MMGRIGGRLFYVALALTAVALGLIWRSGVVALSPWLSKYGGDALWAVMVYAIVRCAQPCAKIRLSALAAFGVCAAVEFGQLYRAPWIDAVRATRVGALALGSVFNWADIPAYGVGVMTAVMIDC